MMRATLFAAIGCACALGLPSLRAAQTATNAAPADKDPLAGLIPDKIVARGKNFEIKRSQVDEAFVAYKVSLAAQGQRIPEVERVNVLNQVLERLINVQVLLAKATEADRAKAQDEADKAVAAYRDKLPSEEAFKRQLLALGMTVEKLRVRCFDEAIFKTVVDRELKPTLKITTQQLKEYYRTNTARYSRRSFRRMRSITWSRIRLTAMQCNTSAFQNMRQASSPAS